MWAYAYELKDDPIVTDAKFDAICLKVDLRVATDRPDMDAWFVEHFTPHTGQWIHQHPELEGLERIYHSLRNV